MSKTEAIPYLVLGFIVLIMSKFIVVHIFLQSIAVLTIIYVISQSLVERKPETNFEKIIYFILTIIVFIWAYLSFEIAEFIISNGNSFIGFLIGIVIFIIPIKLIRSSVKIRRKE